MTSFTITEANLDMGYLTVAFNTPTGATETMNVYIESVVASSDATELELINGVSQLVKQRLAQLFPPAPPQPTAVLAMIGRPYEVVE